MLRRWQPCWLHLYLRCLALGWLRRATTAALAGRWRSLWGAAPPQLCHAASPLPQRQRPEWLFLAGPAQSVHTRAAPLSSFNAMDLGSSKSLQATAMIPAWLCRPRHQKRLVDKTLICTVSCTNAVQQQQQQQPASSLDSSLDSGLQGWRRSCSPETAAAVPGPAGRQSSAPQSLATGNSEGGSVPCQEQIPSTQLKADPYSDDCRPPSRQQHPGMLQIPGSVTCVW